MWEYISSDELYHYGVKGQKWGVRKAREATIRTRPQRKEQLRLARKKYREQGTTGNARLDKTIRARKIAIATAAAVTGAAVVAAVATSHQWKEPARMLVTSPGRNVGELAVRKLL